MKTPREILLAQHRAAEPKLDTIRRAIVAEQFHHQDTKAQSWPADLVAWCLGGLNTCWRELIIPNHRIWAGLTTVWILIAVINLSQRDPATSIAGKATSVPVMISFREQQRLMNELFADRSMPAVAEPPKTFSPKPRTQTISFSIA